MKTDWVDIKEVLRRKIREGDAARDLIDMVSKWEEENLPEYDAKGKLVFPPRLHMLFATLLDPEYLGTDEKVLDASCCPCKRKEP